MLAPVASKLGIDMIWFGVLLCVNMQTSFMHPPFGFALFYLRGAADSIFKAGSLPKKVLSKDIYLGSIPFVLLQLILVVIVIFFPQTVTIFVDKQQVIDINSVKIEVPEQTNQESDEQTANEQLMKSFK
jgi:TRAP-type mannitol/chloroaromatic compound transport system permease large subunit